MVARTITLALRDRLYSGDMPAYPPGTNTFLGASICSINTSIGWGTQQSQLSVTLVEDVGNGDSFNPPAVGQPCYFTCGSLNFGGLLQSWRKVEGESGELYEVVVVDPREILDGVQIILEGNRSDVSAIPNLYNVYDYWEDTGYGNSLVNETGMPWQKITSAMNTLLASKPISFRGFTYTVVFTNLEPLPAYYRVGGESISLMDFIDDICNATGCDYFVKLTAGGVITIHTISRRIIPVFGALTNFVNAQTGVVSKEIGHELRNETNAKYLIGGQKNEFVFNWHVATSGFGDPNNMQIWPYWGTWNNGNAIMGSGNWAIAGNETVAVHELFIDTSPLNDNLVGNTYHTDTAELRAAMIDENTWQRFLLCEESVGGSIHDGKANAFGLTATLGNYRPVLNQAKQDIQNKKRVEFLQLLASQITNMKVNDDKFTRIHRLYAFLKNYADQYYGLKFMVRMPYVTSILESESSRIIRSHDPTDSAFIDSINWINAITNHILPSSVFRFMNAENKFECYVRFNPGDYDLTDLTADEYEKFDNYIFVKATVDENVVYRDYNNLTDPRAVITLAGRIIPSGSDYAQGQFKEYELALRRQVLGPKLTDTEKAKLISRVGSDIFYLSQEGASYVPNMVALPVQFNTAAYGPWYALGADGKVEYEKDETLVPWNYGGYTALDIVGNAHVNTTISYEQANEGGVIVVPDMPTKNIGDQIIAQSGYPYITDVNVSVGAQGVTTTYHVQQWTPRFGTLEKYNIERFKRYSMQLQKERKRTQRIWKKKHRRDPARIAGLRASRFLGRLIEHQNRTSSSVVMAEVVPVLNPSGIGGYTPLSFTECVIAPYYNIGMPLGYNYTRKSLAGLESIFRPFCIATSGYVDEDTSTRLLPRFELPTVTASEPTVTDLNPFIEPHDFSIFAQGSGVPTDGLAISVSGYAEDSQYRPIALRAPLVLCGWGYDTDGNPVPSGGDGEFLTNHRRRQDKWKVGPLDARWDNDRKVWEASGGDSIDTIKIYNPLLPGGQGSGRLVTGTAYTTQTGNMSAVFDPLYSVCALSGEKINIITKNNRYETIAEYGLTRRGTLTEDLIYGSYADATIHNVGITVYDHLLDANSLVNSPADIIVSYDRYDHKWYLVSATCSGGIV